MMSNRNTFAGTAALFAAVALVAGAVSPAMAQGNDPSEKPASAKAEKPKRYCAISGETGSIVSKRVCLTREEWLQKGVDPAKKR